MSQTLRNIIQVLHLLALVSIAWAGAYMNSQILLTVFVIAAGLYGFMLTSFYRAKPKRSASLESAQAWRMKE